MAERRFFVDENSIMGNSATLFDEERNHLVNVLRMREGDVVTLVRGDGMDYHAKIDTVEKKSVTLTITEIVENQREPKVQLDLFQGVGKGEKMELITQKITELGLTSLVPFVSQFTVAKESKIKLDRLNKITREAVKQCKRSNAVKVYDAVKFSTMLDMLKSYDLVVFAYENENKGKLHELFLENSNYQKVAIIVGSEGGFAQSEADEIVNAGAKSVGLGKRIMRLETCAISLSSLVMFLLGEMQ